MARYSKIISVVITGIFVFEPVSWASPSFQALAPKSKVQKVQGRGASAAPLMGLIVTTTAGTHVGPVQRGRVEKLASPTIVRAVDAKVAFAFGAKAPPLSKQSSDEELALRAKNAHRWMKKAARIAGVGRRFASRRLLIIADDGEPFLSHTGDIHLIGLSGNWPWLLQGISPSSYYIKLALVEAAIEWLGKENGLKFLTAWLRCQTASLDHSNYVPPSRRDNRILKAGYAKIFAATRFTHRDRILLDVLSKDIPRNVKGRYWDIHRVLAAARLGQIAGPAAIDELISLGLDRPTAQTRIRQATGMVGTRPLSAMKKACEQLVNFHDIKMTTSLNEKRDIMRFEISETLDLSIRWYAQERKSETFPNDTLREGKEVRIAYDKEGLHIRGASLCSFTVETTVGNTFEMDTSKYGRVLYDANEWKKQWGDRAPSNPILDIAFWKAPGKYYLKLRELGGLFFFTVVVPDEFLDFFKVAPDGIVISDEYDLKPGMRITHGPRQLWFEIIPESEALARYEDLKDHLNFQAPATLTALGALSPAQVGHAQGKRLPTAVWPGGSQAPTEAAL